MNTFTVTFKQFSISRDISSTALHSNRTVLVTSREGSYGERALTLLCQWVKTQPCDSTFTHTVKKEKQHDSSENTGT